MFKIFKKAETQIEYYDRLAASAQAALNLAIVEKDQSHVTRLRRKIDELLAKHEYAVQADRERRAGMCYEEHGW